MQYTRPYGSRLKNFKLSRLHLNYYHPESLLLTTQFYVTNPIKHGRNISLDDYTTLPGKSGAHTLFPYASQSGEPRHRRPRRVFRRLLTIRNTLKV